MSHLLLSNIHQQVKKLLPPINKKLLDNFSLPKKISYKSGSQASISIVTQLDAQIENYLKKQLKKILPQAGFIGEETAIKVKEYNWIVDPIDGTLNYARQLPDFAVSIALWHNNEPIYAITSFPILKEIVHSFNNSGIYLNGEKYHSIFKPSQKLLAAFSLVSAETQASRIYHQLQSVVPSPRSYGSCVVHGAFTALNRIDVTVLINQAIWDIAAIVLLAKSAGLACHYLSLSPNLAKDHLKQYQYSVILGRPKLVSSLAKKIKL